MSSLSDLLAAAAGHLPPHLVPAPALERAQRVLRTQSTAVPAVVCLECRLGDDSRVDPSFGVPPGRLGDFAGPEVAARSPEWVRVADLCGRASLPGSAVHGRIGPLWLEFDDPGEGEVPDVPVPGILFSVEEGFPALHRSDAECGLALREVVRPLADEGWEPGTGQALRRVLRLVPDGALVSDLGIFLSRGAATVRVCVANLTPDATAGYLAAVGWDGNGEDLTALLRETAGAVSGRFRVPLLHLDVGAAVCPRLGLEYLLDRQAQVSGPPAEAAFLDDLMRRGVCTREKRAALDRWPGWSLACIGDEERAVLRRVNSIKLIHRSGQPLEAKAYLMAINASVPVDEVRRSLAASNAPVGTTA
ncbi:MAG: hypothetical protein JWM27_3558 [Gemmatimonadetes bacterium]|nr:hypothetical protein [Gemmatimonadota bacterium]